MQRVPLQRIRTGDSGTFGVVAFGGLTFQSGELPERGNDPGLSCIPPGVYMCHVAYSPHFQRDLYHVQDVPGRSDILIHPANYMGDRSKGLKCELLGCIALGSKTVKLDGQEAVVESRYSVQRFMELMNDADFELEVLDIPQTSAA